MNRRALVRGTGLSSAPATGIALRPRWVPAEIGSGPQVHAEQGVRRALDEDLDTPTAVGLIDEAAVAGTDVTPAAALLGVHLRS